MKKNNDFDTCESSNDCSSNYDYSSTNAIYSYFSYVEPSSFPIGKLEKFDEDNMMPLICDEDLNKKDRMKLSLFNKHRVSGGSISVCYKFAKGCENLCLGRLYPEGNIGLQEF